IAGVEEVESLVDTHKKSETNQQVSDFHTTEGSVNGSLTDRHYASRASFLHFYARRAEGREPLIPIR
ncbi:hypothetical protein ACEUDE_12975, partial [Aeromonas veronii]